MKTEPLHHFGDCPHCDKAPEYLNNGADHWMLCPDHKVTWRIGSNLFSCWRTENEQIWNANRETLEQCSVIEHPPRPQTVDV